MQPCNENSMKFFINIEKVFKGMKKWAKLDVKCMIKLLDFLK